MKEPARTFPRPSPKCPGIADCPIGLLCVLCILRTEWCCFSVGTAACCASLAMEAPRSPSKSTRNDSITECQSSKHTILSLKSLHETSVLFNHITLQPFSHPALSLPKFVGRPWAETSWVICRTQGAGCAFSMKPPLHCVMPMWNSVPRWTTRGHKGGDAFV